MRHNPDRGIMDELVEYRGVVRFGGSGRVRPGEAVPVGEPDSILGDAVERLRSAMADVGIRGSHKRIGSRKRLHQTDLRVRCRW